MARAARGAAATTARHIAAPAIASSPIGSVWWIAKVAPRTRTITTKAHGPRGCRSAESSSRGFML